MPHIVIGAGSLGVVLMLLSVILISGKSRKAQAHNRAVIEITLPDQAEMIHAARLRATAELDGSDLSDIKEPSAPMAAPTITPVALHSNIAIGSGGLTTRPGVVLTPELANFASGLSTYCAEHHLNILVTSGVRSGEGQLEIIKQKIIGAHMTGAFPGLMGATVADREIWTPAWEWLKRQRIPVNPPADCIKHDGTEAGASLHIKGLALDVVGGNLDALTHALVKFAASPEAQGALRMTSLTRERDCVHIALTR